MRYSPRCHSHPRTERILHEGYHPARTSFLLLVLIITLAAGVRLSAAPLVYPLLEKRIIRPWELPLYPDDNGIPRFVVTFPPFVMLPRTLSLGNGEKALWEFHAEPYGGGPLISGRISIPERIDGDTIFSDHTIARYLPRLPISKILFTHTFTLPPATTNGMKLITPMLWAESETYINERRVSCITGWQVRDRGFTRETIFPQSTLRGGSNTIKSLLYLSNHTADIASYFEAGEVVVSYTISNISPYADMVDVLYRRSDLYGFELFRSSLHPFPVVETVWKSVYIGGLSNDRISLSHGGLFIATNYHTFPLAGEAFSLRTNRPPTRNWIMLFGGNENGRDYPLLVVYNMPLLAITSLENGIIRLDFPYEMMYTYIAVVPLSDSKDGIPRARSISLHSYIDKELTAKCDEIARIAFSMPVRIRGNVTIPSAANFSYDEHESLFTSVRQAPLPPEYPFPSAVPFGERRTLKFAGTAWRYVR
ncbi:MAG: hypothetical protein AABZ39_02180 [Spirochaetota bacterium]